MRRIRIRTKVMAALALPVLVLLGITGVEVVQGLRDADHIREQAQMARAATGPNGLFSAIQNERNRTAVDLLGQGGVLELPCDDLAACRRDTDRSLERFDSLLDAQGDEASAAYAPVLAELDRLIGLRADADAYDGPTDLTNVVFTDQVFDRYTELIARLLEANTQLSVAIDDPDLRRGADLSYMANWQTDLMARSVSLFLVAAVTDGLDNQELQEGAGLVGLAQANYADIQGMATDEYADARTKLVEEELQTGFLNQVAPEILETGQVTDLLAVLESVSVDNDRGFYGFRENVAQIVDAKADDLVEAANRRTYLFWALAVVVVSAALMATWLVTRSITRPLRALTRQAAEMANDRLPGTVRDILDTPFGDDITMPSVAPVTVHTRDEVGDVAAALNTVQDSALDLAVEQAVLRRNIADSFVNLGRRNQNLLGRQLDFITELEHRETDPDTLGNLFRLDHLATRMRRNAESLLVLAGIDGQRKWAAPVRINDVIRAALGEVEDYQRVTLRAIDPATVLGSAATDLAHLLAELVENALVFSPPDQTVEIRGRFRPPEQGTGYSLAVIDAGLGMSADELARANRRLAGGESFTIAPSKYLGHYVAGNLAARHGIAVTLHNSPGQDTGAGHGVTAVITLPVALLADGVVPEPETNGDPNYSGLAPQVYGVPDPAMPPPPPLPPGELLPPGVVPSPPPPPPPPPPVDSTHTASGLAKRVPRPMANGPGSVPQAPEPSPELLETLASYASQATATEQTPGGGLARRIRGAQLPNTRPLSVRRRHEDPDA